MRQAGCPKRSPCTGWPAGRRRRLAGLRGTRKLTLFKRRETYGAVSIKLVASNSAARAPGQSRAKTWGTAERTTAEGPQVAEMLGNGPLVWEEQRASWGLRT